jgi:drug/metabolite transporter (DMT)-like permease
MRHGGGQISVSDQLAVILASVAALAVGTGDFIGSRVTKVARPLAAVQIQMVLACVFTIVIIPLIGGELVSGDVWLGSIGGVISAVSIGAFYAGFSIASAGIVAAFTAVSAGVAPVLIDFGLGNEPPAMVLLGAAIAIASLALVTWSNDFEGRVMLGALLGVVTGTGLAVSLAILSETTEDGGMWPILAQRVVSVSIIVVAVRITKTPPLPAGNVRKMGYAAGAISATGIVMLMISAQTGPLTAVAVAGAMFPAITIALSARFDGPRLTTRQVVGVAGVFVGVVVVVLG